MHSHGYTRKSEIFKTTYSLVALKELTGTSNCLCHSHTPCPSLKIILVSKWYHRPPLKPVPFRHCRPHVHLIPSLFFLTFKLGHQVPELLNGVSFIYSCESNCPIWAWSGPIPQLSIWISPGHKKYGFVRWQRFARNALQHQDAVRLLKPTEVQEISVLVENIGDVIAHVVRGVGQQNHCVVQTIPVLGFLLDQHHQFVSAKSIFHLRQSWGYLSCEQIRWRNSRHKGYFTSHMPDSCLLPALNVHGFFVIPHKPFPCSSFRLLLHRAKTDIGFNQLDAVLRISVQRQKSQNLVDSDKHPSVCRECLKKI